MKSILLIGLGRFGKHIAMKLRELNHQVMAVDHKEELVQEILPYVTGAQIGDSTNEEFLRSLGVDNYDVCIVGIGNDFPKGHQVDYVLGNFTDEDMKTMDERLETAGQIVKSFCLAGINITMNQFNKK